MRLLANATAAVGAVVSTTVSLGMNEASGATCRCGRHLRRVATFNSNGDVAGGHDHKSLSVARNALDKEVLTRREMFLTTLVIYCLFALNKIIFFLFSFFMFGMLLKGMGESFLLSEDEPLTPNIDGVMAL